MKPECKGRQTVQRMRNSRLKRVREAVLREDKETKRSEGSTVGDEKHIYMHMA